MTILSDQISHIHVEARDSAFALLAPALRNALPADWSVLLHSTFPGPSVSDAEGQVVWTGTGPASTHYSKQRCPKRLVEVLLAAERFMAVWGGGDEIVRAAPLPGQSALAVALRTAGVCQ